jgi:guanine deaminase
LERGQRRRESSRIDALTAFWLATTSGGIALDLPIGLFRGGYQFDAMVVGNAAGGNLRLEAGDSPQQVLQKIVYNAGRSNISDVWVAGRRV